jgi:beta-phosphoglucomutase family hydrolase
MAKAFLFDLNGTMVDDMNYHITAWHRIVNDLGANLTLEQVKAECYGKNGEVLERIFPNRFSDEEKNRMSIEKEKQYQHEFRPHLKLLNGLDRFLYEAKKSNIKMAIGSAAIMFNVDFVLDGLHIRHFIDVIVSADDVTHSKPHPETFLKCANGLGIAYENCIVFEDAPKGVEAAANAGMKCAVLTTMHTKEEFAAYDNIIAFGKDYNDKNILNFFGGNFLK